MPPGAQRRDRRGRRGVSQAIETSGEIIPENRCFGVAQGAQITYMNRILNRVADSPFGR
jgi:hypothetical protein